LSPAPLWRAAAVGATLTLLVACTADRTGPGAAGSGARIDARLGGGTSAKELRGRPFNQPARNLTNDETRRFGVGAETFNRHTTAAEGLGPTYNDDSCLSCHADGIAPVSADAAQRDSGLPNTGLLLRLSLGNRPDGSAVPEPTYGVQLQTHAVDGATPEGRLQVTWSAVAGAFEDGSTYELRLPTVTAVDLRDGPMDPRVLTSARIAPSMVGLGLLEAIAGTTIVGAADPGDADHDGISGRPNRVTDVLNGATELGRFGWKASQPSVRQQTVVALDQDMGVSTPDLPGDRPGDRTAPPEMLSGALTDMVFYNRTIAVPVARNVDDAAVRRGSVTFERLGCAACHTVTQHSGPDQVDGLADQTIHPYTDLLLHDMGPGLADGRPDGAATGDEWRTAPLWGLGHRVEVVGYGAFLHDGRARTPTEAVLWHGGEAQGAADRFRGLDRRARDDLAAFLGSL